MKETDGEMGVGGGVGPPSAMKPEFQGNSAVQQARDAGVQLMDELLSYRLNCLKRVEIEVLPALPEGGYECQNARLHRR